MIVVAVIAAVVFGRAVGASTTADVPCASGTVPRSPCVSGMPWESVIGAIVTRRRSGPRSPPAAAPISAAIRANIRIAIFHHRSRTIVIVASQPSRGRTASNGSRQSSRRLCQPASRLADGTGDEQLEHELGVRATRASSASSSDSSAVPVRDERRVAPARAPARPASSSVVGGGSSACSAAASSVRPSIASSSSRPTPSRTSAGCPTAMLHGDRIGRDLRAGPRPNRLISRLPEPRECLERTPRRGGIVSAASATPMIAAIAATTGSTSTESRSPRIDQDETTRAPRRCRRPSSPA